MISKLVGVVLCAAAATAPASAFFKGDVRGELNVPIQGRDVVDASFTLTNRGSSNLCFDYWPNKSHLAFQSGSGEEIENNSNEGTIVITERPTAMLVVWADGKPHHYDVGGALGPVFKTDDDAARAASVSLGIPLHDCKKLFADPDDVATPLKITAAPIRMAPSAP